MNGMNEMNGMYGMEANNMNAMNMNPNGMGAAGANENGMHAMNADPNANMMNGMGEKGGMNEQAMLRRQIEAIAFSMLDLRLFLDTHPRDTTAIGLFNRYREKYLVLVGEYERRYGPFNTNYDTSGNVWNWIKNPWPWEFTAEG